MSSYPDNNPKSAIGVTKPGFHAIPPVALIHLGAGMEDGRVKYGLVNWRDNSVAASVYYDAALRHWFAWWDGEERDPVSGVHHLGHAMACASIILDAMSGGNLIDDRGITGTFGKVVREMTAAKAKAQTTAPEGTAKAVPEEAPKLAAYSGAGLPYGGV